MLDHAIGATTDGLGLTFDQEVAAIDEGEEDYIEEIIKENFDINDDAMDIVDD